MRQLIFTFGISLFATVSFSQQQAATSERKASAVPVSKSNEQIQPVNTSDSVAVLHSSSRSIQSEIIPVSKEIESTTEKQPEKTTVSSAKKPD